MLGRVENLKKLPHLKMIVTKDITAPALEAAMADGFFVIRLDAKAERDNAQEIYQEIYRSLNELFIGIAPPQDSEI